MFACTSVPAGRQTYGRSLKKEGWTVERRLIFRSSSQSELLDVNPREQRGQSQLPPQSLDLLYYALANAQHQISDLS